MISFLNKDKEFIQFFLVQFGYFAFTLLSWSLIPLYFIQNGVTFIELTIYFLIVFLSSGLTTLFFRKLKSTTLIQCSILIRIALFALVFVIVYKTQVYIAGALFGAFLALFWIPYNTRYAGFTKQDNRAYLMGLRIASAVVVGVSMPALGGFIANYYGFKVLFIIGAACFAILFLLAGKLPEKTIEFHWKNAVTTSTEGLRSLMFLGGLWQTVYFVIIPIITLQFIKTPENYGLFLSMLGLFGATASLLVAKISDKKQVRSRIIYPVMIALGVFTMLAGLSINIYYWIVFIALTMFVRSIAEPFMGVILIESKREIPDIMLSHGFFHYVGRVAGTLAVLFELLTFGNVIYSTVLIGFLFLFYPLILHKRGIYHEEDQKMKETAQLYYASVASTITKTFDYNYLLTEFEDSDYEEPDEHFEVEYEDYEESEGINIFNPNIDVHSFNNHSDDKEEKKS